MVEMPPSQTDITGMFVDKVTKDGTVVSPEMWPKSILSMEIRGAIRQNPYFYL